MVRPSLSSVALVVVVVVVVSAPLITAFAPILRTNVPTSSAVAAFSPNQNRQPPRWRHHPGRHRLSMSMSMSMSAPMDLLSDGCVRALSYGQDASRGLGLRELGNEMLLVGMIRSAGAEDMEVRRVLTSFGISPDGALKAAEVVLSEGGGGSSSIDDAGFGEGLGFGDSSPLPFSSAAKRTLDDAISIARRMSSSPDSGGGVVLPGHVLLALLEYDDRYGVATEDVAKCAGLAVLVRTSRNSPVSREFDGTRFCRALADELKRGGKVASSSSSSSGGGSGAKMTEREVVFVNGDRVGGSTPTLDKVGIDLTEMAREGRLDAVYGRENEIRMCLRTLGRRRKSNPCLIGEPGVGKTAIAEGVAQCLAGGYYVYDDKGGGSAAEGGDGGGWGLRNPFRTKEADAATDNKSVAGLSREEVDQLPPLPPCPRALQVRFIFVFLLFRAGKGGGRDAKSIVAHPLCS